MRVMTEAQALAHQRKHGRKAVGASAALGDRKTSTVTQGRALRKPKADYGRMLAQQIKAAGLPEPVLEFAFDAQLDGSGRAWRFDLAWPGWLALDIGKLAVEVDGGVHKLRKRFDADIPKHQAAFSLGYKLLRVSPEQVKSGEALEFIRRALT